MENRQAGKTLNEIEITPEMVASGRRELLDFDERYEPADAAVIRVFEAMMAACVSCNLIKGRRSELTGEITGQVGPHDW